MTLHPSVTFYVNAVNGLECVTTSFNSSCRGVTNRVRIKGCGVSEVTGSASLYSMYRVIGGKDSKEREFPWSVRLTDGASTCGGTIINTRTVLTAAHCVSWKVDDAPSVKIEYGSVNSSALTYINASRVDVHPNYTRRGSNDDIAVVTLSQDLPINLPRACLPSASTAYTPDKMCIVTGWGHTREGGPNVPDVLQKAELPIVACDVCNKAYATVTNLVVGERQLCAGYYQEGGISACKGDSGGPLVCPEGDRWVIYGIVSKGFGCARPHFMGINTYVPPYEDWIRSLMSRK